MKHFLFIIFLWNIYSCIDKKKTDKEIPSVVKKVVIPQSDSFNVRDLNTELSLQSDISLDTINIRYNKRHTELTIIYPKLSQKQYPEISRQINQFVSKEKKEFNEIGKNEKPEYDSSLHMYRIYEITIRPMSLYQTEKVISFGIEKYFGNGFSSGFEYNVINYDLMKKKEILLGDYFLLNTVADSIFLNNIVSRAINGKFSAEYLGALNFSFDDNYIYFYFDKYNIFAWGIWSVKKKYILDHINPEYR